MIRSLCALANNSGFKPARLNINDTAREVLLLTRADVQRHGIELQTDLMADNTTFSPTVFRCSRCCET
jgi:hypothetical protein